MMPSALDTIDDLVKTLLDEGTVYVTSPTQQQWLLREDITTRRTKRLGVYYKVGNQWYPLNHGWRAADESHPQHYPYNLESAARIIIGQIFVGERQSGKELQNLFCGLIINDSKRYEDPRMI